MLHAQTGSGEHIYVKVAHDADDDVSRASNTGQTGLDVSEIGRR